MAVLISVAAALVPGLLLVWYFTSRDRFPEPRHRVWKTFGLGCAIVVPVVPIALLLSLPFEGAANPHFRALTQAFFGAAIPEEALKLAVLFWYCRRKHEFDEPMDGLVYGATVSLGFATFENVLYVLDGGLTVALLRAFTAVPGHAATGAIMGFYLGLAHFLPHRRRRYLWLAFLVPVALHGLYNYPAMLAQIQSAAAGELPDAMAGFIALGLLGALVVEVAWALILQRRLVRSQRQRLRGAAA